MLVNPQDAAVVQEPIENVWRLVGGRRNYLRMEGAVLIGDMGVKAEPWIDTVAGVDVATGRSSLSAAEELTVRTRRGAMTPNLGEWQDVMSVDQMRQGGRVAIVADIGVLGPD